LTNEGIPKPPAHGGDCRLDEEGAAIPNVYRAASTNVDGAAIPTNDVVPGEMVISYDKDNPSIEVGTMYPSMEEFKLAVRQYAIKKRFHLGIEKSCKTRYRAYCKSGDEEIDCPWRINGTKLKGSANVEVIIYVIIYF
jgi:hypothetical protein